MSAIRHRRGTTRLAGVIGWPVEHSLSPVIHNAAFAALGMDWAYVALPVAPGAAARRSPASSALGFAGANVTMPHKEAVAAAVEVLSDDAARLRAVNTIEVTAAGPVGHNTDAPGFERFLERDAGFDAAGRTASALRRRRGGPRVRAGAGARGPDPAGGRPAGARARRCPPGALAGDFDTEVAGRVVRGRVRVAGRSDRQRHPARRARRGAPAAAGRRRRRPRSTSCTARRARRCRSPSERRGSRVRRPRAAPASSRTLLRAVDGPPGPARGRCRRRRWRRSAGA